MHVGVYLNFIVGEDVTVYESPPNTVEQNHRTCDSLSVKARVHNIMRVGEYPTLVQPV